MNKKKNKKKEHILIIDDDTDLCEILKYTLSKRGYKISVAHNGKEGIINLKKNSPDLIVLDLHLPEMGGIEFLEHIKDKDNLTKYPVLILTARKETKELFKNLDVKGFIDKPFEMEIFVGKIKNILGKKEKRKTFKKKNGTVLLAEYDQKIFDKIALLCLNKGKTIISAKTGVEAIERANNKGPDLCLISLNLPDLSGDLVAYRIKKLEATRDKKVIVYNTEANIGQKTDILELCTKEGVKYSSITVFEQLLEEI
ncbi:MAG: response regulator [Candidatus Omnitrophica bacterium]|nr:response regulator [Candidatus Omnitrophota bacterium]